MRAATTIEASSFDHWPAQRDFVVEAEKLGLDICWVAEAWGSDAQRSDAARVGDDTSRHADSGRRRGDGDHVVESVRGTVPARSRRFGSASHKGCTVFRFNGRWFVCARPWS